MVEFPASKVHMQPVQPDLLGGFPADVCPHITGQFRCGRSGGGGCSKEIECSQRAKFTTLVGGGGGKEGKRGFWQIAHGSYILDMKSPQTTYISYFRARFSFRGHIISSKSPSQQKVAWRTNILRNRSIECPCFYHTDLGQNAVFQNFAIQIALIQYSGQSKHALGKPLKKFPIHLYGEPVLTFDERQSRLFKLRYASTWWLYNDV